MFTHYNRGDGAGPGADGCGIGAGDVDVAEFAVSYTHLTLPTILLV